MVAPLRLKVDQKFECGNQEPARAGKTTVGNARRNLSKMAQQRSKQLQPNRLEISFPLCNQCHSLARPGDPITGVPQATLQLAEFGTGNCFVVLCTVRVVDLFLDSRQLPGGLKEGLLSPSRPPSSGNAVKQMPRSSAHCSRVSGAAPSAQSFNCCKNIAVQRGSTISSVLPLCCTTPAWWRRDPFPACSKSNCCPNSFSNPSPIFGGHFEC